MNDAKRLRVSDHTDRYLELLEAQDELGKLPADIEVIIAVEQMGFCVDLVTGDLRPDTDRFAVTLVGERVAIAANAWQEGEGA
jgi:hypothetical protein